MLYLSGGHPKVLPDGLGEMLVPLKGNQPRSVWAADTGCFTRPEAHTDEGYLAWLAMRLRAPFPCLFATAPDVVGDAEATLARSVPVLSRIRALGVRAALVGQDGMTPDMVPWDALDAFFVGGTTAWKLGDAAAELVAKANARGKWTHMGRVNSRKRVMYARSLRCDSVDGTYLAFAPDVNGPRAASWAAQARMQQVLW